VANAPPPPMLINSRGMRCPMYREGSTQRCLFSSRDIETATTFQGRDNPSRLTKDDGLKPEKRVDRPTATISHQGEAHSPWGQLSGSGCLGP
jgi:hypothetical protein